jgi:hypothetical protein
MAAAPRHQSRTWHDIGTSCGILSLWIVPWLILTAATWIAGGHPSVSPVAFINPGEIARRIGSGSGAFPLWVLVAPTSTVVAWRFWASLVIIIGAISAAGVAARVQIARIPRGRLRRFLPADRQVVRSAHWARAMDLRSLRARPGRAGIFLLGRHGRRRLATQP